MDYDKQFELLQSLLNKNDKKGFINFIKNLDQEDKLIDLYNYLQFEADELFLEKFKNLIYENDETLNIFASSLPDVVMTDIETGETHDNLISRIDENLKPNLLILAPNALEYLELAIDEKDDEFIEGFYNNFINLSDSQKTKLIKTISDFQATAKNIIKENYNTYSTKIFKSLLKIKKRDEDIKLNFMEYLQQGIEDNDEEIIKGLADMY